MKFNIINDLDSFKSQIKSNSMKNIENRNTQKDLIINPIHSSLNVKELLMEISSSIDSNEEEILNQYDILNHHEATALVLSDWKEETDKQGIKTIEITGVKGKTSVAFLLKEIFLENHKNTLLLSSLGAYLFRKNEDDEQKIILQKNISITPANIRTTAMILNTVKESCASTMAIIAAQTGWR